MLFSILTYRAPVSFSVYMSGVSRNQRNNTRRILVSNGLQKIGTSLFHGPVTELGLMSVVEYLRSISQSEGVKKLTLKMRQEGSANWTTIIDVEPSAIV